MIGGGSLGKLVVYLGADTADLVTEFSKAEREAAKFSKALDASLKAAAVAAGAAAVSGIVAIAGAIKVATDRADALAKAAQRAGVEVEKFSKINFAASLSDVSTEQLQTGFAQLSKKIADESSKASEALTALGVSARDSYGKIRPSDEILTDIAALFAGMEDGATKAALAQELFGKSGVQLIPMLNSGAEGLRSMSAEAEALGLVVSGGLAQSSQQLNDNITRITSAFAGFGNQLAERVTPALADLSGGFSDFIKDTGLVYSAADGIINAMKGILIAVSLVKNGLDVIARSIIGVFETAAESINFLLRLSDAAAAGIGRTKAQLAANSIEEFKKASSLEGFSDVFEREFSAYSQRVGNIWGATADGMREDIADLVGAFESLQAAQKDAGTGATDEQIAATQRAQAVLDRLAATTDAAAAAAKRKADADRDLAKAAREVEQASQSYNNLLDSLLQKYAPIEAAARQYRDAVLQMVQAHELGAISTEELERITALLEKRFKDTADEAKKAANAMTPFQQAVQSLVREIDNLNNGDVSGVEAEFRQLTQNMGDLTAEQQAALRSLLQLKSEASRFADTMEQASRGAADALGEFAAEVLFNFDDIGESWDKLGENLLSTAKRIVAQLLSEFARLELINPIINGIFGTKLQTGGSQLGGLFGQPGQAAQPGSGAVPSWLQGALGNAAIGGLIGGGRGAIGGAILGQIGSAFGPIGSAIGAVIGGILGSLGSKKPDDYRFGGATSNVRKPEGSFETDFGTVRAGSRGLSYEALIQPIQEFDSAISEMLTNLGVGSDQLDSIRASLSRWSVDLKGDAATAENVLNSRFGAILATFNEDVQAFVGATGDVEDRVARLADALQIQDILDAGELGSTFSEVAATLEEYRQNNEDLAATYERIMAATAVYESALQVLGDAFEGSRQDLIGFAADFAEAAGGVAEAAALWNDYFNVFLSPLERLQAAVDAAQANATSELGDIGLDPTTTREQFRELFDAIRGTLSPEDLVQWLEAARAIGVLIDAEGALSDFRDQEGAAAAAALAEAEREAADEAARLADAIQRQAGFQQGLVEQLQDDALSQYGDRLAQVIRRYQQNIATAKELGDATGDTAAAMRSMALAARIARNGLAEVRQALIESIQGLVQQLQYSTNTALQNTVAPDAAAVSFGGGGDPFATVNEGANGFFDNLQSGFESLEQWLQQSIFGELSGLSPEAQYAAVLAQIQEAAALIRGGGEGAAAALDGFPELLNQFLQLSRTINASGSNFNADAQFARALAEELLALQGTLVGTNPGGGGTLGAGGPGDFTGDTGSGAVSGAPVGLTEADRLLLATQLAQQLRELAAITAQPLLDLAQTFGVDLAAFFADLGIDIGDLSAANVAQLATIANQLGIDLADIDATLGLGLGDLADSLSPINDALESVINSLAPELRDSLAPLLDALENAETPEERAAAQQALVNAILASNPDIQNLFAPFFAEIDTTDELSGILDQITDVAIFTGESLDALDAVKRSVEAVAAPVVDSIGNLSTANGEGFDAVVSAINEMANQQAQTAAAPDKSAAAAFASGPDTSFAKSGSVEKRDEAIVIAIETAIERIAQRQDDQARQATDLIHRLGSDIKDGIQSSDSRMRAAGGSYGC